MSTTTCGKRVAYSDADRKPDVLPVDPAGVPEALRLERRWVVWRLTWRADKKDANKGQWSKVPLRPSGRAASSTDPATWCTFADAVAAYRRGGYDGIGFVLGDGFAGIDLDAVRDPVTGELTPDAAALVADLSTYAEVSPSATGLKIFGRGVWAGGWHRKPFTGGGEIEVYSAGRFFTVTGGGVGNYPVADIQASLDALAKLTESKPKPPPKPGPGPQAGGDDDELVRRATRASNGAKFARLWSGDASDFGGDSSRADLALAGMLLFWVGGDAARADALFRRSGLYRPKWDERRGEQTYGERTMATALEGKTSFYEPGPRARFGTGPTNGKPHPPGDAGTNPDDARGDDEPATERPFLTDTDLGNAARFVADHGDDVRYVADWSQWVVWDGRRWVVDRSETLVEARAKATADALAREAAERIGEAARAIAASGESDGPEADSLKKKLKQAQADLSHAKKTCDVRSMKRMLQAARSDQRVCVPEGGKVFDIRRDLLNCVNGTVELRTGSPREHRRGDFITRLCPTRYNPAATRRTYLEFLSTIFDGKPAVAEYVRSLGGYVCTGEVTDQTLNILNGDGSNGKNVLTDTWKVVLGEGEYAHTAPPDLLLSDEHGRHPTEKTGLRGARLVVCSETDEYAAFDEAKLKSLTGGDTVAARFMRGDFFQFEPTHKLVLLTNNRPRVRGTDHGVWRRIRLVPFAAKFWKDADKELDPAGDYPERFRADPTLGRRLQSEEAEGVLADMVERAAGFYRAGKLDPPAEVTGATAEYRTDQDTIGQFFAARVRADEDGPGVKASELYKTFTAWWEAEGFGSKRVPTVTKFGREAKRKFNSHTPHGVVYRVRILPDTPSEGPRV